MGTIEIDDRQVGARETAEGCGPTGTGLQAPISTRRNTVRGLNIPRSLTIGELD